MSRSQVRGEGSGRGPRQTLRGRPGLPNTRVQDVRDAEGGFLDGGGVQRKGAAAGAGRGAVGGRPEAEVGRVEGRKIVHISIRQYTNMTLLQDKRASLCIEFLTATSAN